MGGPNKALLSLPAFLSSSILNLVEDTSLLLSRSISDPKRTIVLFPSLGLGCYQDTGGGAHSSLVGSSPSPTDSKPANV